MTEIVSAVAAKVSEYLVAPIGRQLSYLFCYRSHLDDLNKEVQELGHVKDDLQITVDEAKRRGDDIRPSVEDWLTRADKKTREAKTFMEDEKKRTKSCFNGWCPNLKSRYQLGREADKKAQVIAEIREHRNFPDGVSYSAPAPNVTYKNDDPFESRTSILNEIMDALRDDKNSMIGVWGMGGVGKTTLVEQVAARAKQQKLFDRVVMAYVSQTVDLKKIQAQIADALGLKFEEESETGRAGRLSQRLTQEKKLLIILDDLWAGLNLKDVGIPSDHKGLKMVLTSRELDVLSNEMGTQENFAVEDLPPGEAWSLFKKMTSDSIEKPDLQPTAEEVLKKCGGLPIAIVTVAKALKGKDATVWRDALRQLTRSTETTVKGIEAKIFLSLELSYNHLYGDEVKSLFLLCGLMDYGDIPTDNLFKYVVGLDLFQNINALEEARDRLHTLINDLKASSLLLESNRDAYVRMHDVVRQVARAIASKDPHRFVVREDDRLEEWSKTDESKSCTFISLNCRAAHELPKCLGSTIQQLPNEMVQLTNLRLLDLNNCWKLEVIPRNILSSLSRLECLYMKSSFKRWAIEGESNDFLSELNHLSHLTILELDIHIPDIKLLPKEYTFFEKLTRYSIFIGDWRTLKLNEVDRSLYVGDGIGKLFKKTEELVLRKLIGTKSIPYELDEGFCKLKHLHVSASPEIQYVIDSKDQRVQQHGAFPSLESLILDELINLEEVCCGPIPVKFFDNLKTLDVEKCHGLKFLFSLSMARGLLQLEKIEIKSCNVIQQIVVYERESEIKEDDHVETNLQPFPKLRSLKLEDLPELMNFGYFDSKLEMTSQGTCSQGNLDIHMPFFSYKVSFPLNLEKLVLKRLPKLMEMDAGNLPNLRILLLEELCLLSKVSFPPNLEELVLKRLPKLMEMDVGNLPNLKILQLEELHGWLLSKVSFSPNLEEIVLKSLPKLKEIDFGILPKLKILKVEKLPQLVLSSSMFKNFHNLKELHIIDCGMEDMRGVNTSTNDEVLFNEKASFLESRASTLNDIMDALRNDNINLIGVWGMAGVGKTTLLKQVAQQAKQHHLFTRQAHIDLSSIPDSENLRQRIAKALGFIDDIWEENESISADELKQALKEEKILIIFDDIWTEVDLEQVGIPSKDDIWTQCKIVLASRDGDLLCKGMGAQICFPVEYLPLEEAWSLFKKTTGDFVEENLELRPIAIQVVKECEGLPIAIVAIAKALKDETVVVWKNALEQLRSCAPTNIRAVGKKVYSCLSLFLLCGMLGSGDISLDLLLLYGMGLDLFDRTDSLEQAINRLFDLVEILRASGLLLDSHEFVKMHNVICDVVREIASKDPHPFVVREDVGLEEWSETDESKSCTFISLNCKAMHELPQGLVCPELQYIALIGKLTKLEVLSLVGSTIQRLPKEMMQLTNLRLLDLGYCKELEVIPRNILSSESNACLSELNHLSYLTTLLIEIPDAKLLPKDILFENLTRYAISIGYWVGFRTEKALVLKEVNRSLHLGDGMSKLLEKSEELEFHQLSTKYVLYPSDRRVFHMKGSRNKRRWTCWDQLATIPKIAILETCKTTTTHQLQFELETTSSTSLSTNARSEGSFFSHKVSFPKLEELTLKDLPKLKDIWHHQLPFESFSNLQILRVYECPYLLNLVPLI
ncbi:hypothetical protein AAG906_013055 [Vitis piasezkii]